MDLWELVSKYFVIATKIISLIDSLNQLIQDVREFCKSYVETFVKSLIVINEHKDRRIIFLQTWDSYRLGLDGMLNNMFYRNWFPPCDILANKRSKGFFKTIDAIKEIDGPSSVHEDRVLTKEEYELNIIYTKTTLVE